jgi:hypothetical protein
LTIANARGFGGSVNQAVLAKLMLAERFQQDFYDHLAGQAMLADHGKIAELRDMEALAREHTRTAKGKKVGKGEKAVTQPDQDTAKWLERDWLARWLKIQPMLGEVDLRPYVFVARDKRIFAAAAESTGLESLIDTLMSNSDVAVRSVEPQVKALQPADAAQVFATLQERVVRHGTHITEPPGFGGLMIVAKHHPQHQTELISLLGGIDAKALGFWVVKGWNEILTEHPAMEQLQTLLAKWAAQDDNPGLKKMAGQALTTSRLRAG